ncbi:hypothetical protein JCM3766R1_002135 [Sporobolomyces carnicolor]
MSSEPPDKADQGEPDQLSERVERLYLGLAGRSLVARLKRFSSPSPFSRLPPELVRQIIKSSISLHYGPSTYHERRRTLRTFCLVSRLFHEISKPLLESVICIRNLQHLEKTSLPLWPDNPATEAPTPPATRVTFFSPLCCHNFTSLSPDADPIGPSPSTRHSSLTLRQNRLSYGAHAALKIQFFVSILSVETGFPSLSLLYLPLILRLPNHHPDLERARQALLEVCRDRKIEVVFEEKDWSPDGESWFSADFQNRMRNIREAEKV